MPRALRGHSTAAQRRALGWMSEGYSGVLGEYSVDTQGTEGAFAVAGCTLGYSRVYTRAHARERSKAELFGFSGFESAAVRPPLLV